MKRIQTSTALVDKFGPGKPGFFDGNAATGVEATDLEARFFDGLQESIVRVQEYAGEAGSDDPDQFLNCLLKIMNSRLGGRSITDLPTEDIGPITVNEVAETWIWVETPYYTGYRSPLCGRAIFGHTTVPLAGEVDATGGLLPKVQYARLWAYARENGLVVTQEVWTANKGAHYFVDVDADYFRVPDLRDMFLRMSGTDADTANARTLGSRQRDALQNITGGPMSQGYSSPSGALYADAAPSGAYGGGTSNFWTTRFDASRVARTSTETRGPNTACAPRIHT